MRGSTILNTFVICSFCCYSLMIVPNVVGVKDGLVAYYPFDGNARDESGNGNHGTVYDAALTTDVFGNTDGAYSFDGADDYIAVDMNTTFNNEITIAAWVYIFETTGDSQIIYYNGASKGEVEIIIADDMIPHIQVKLLDGTWYSGYSPTLESLNANTWYHLAGSYSGSFGELLFYLNGELTSTLPTPALPLWRYPGWLSSIGVYDQASGVLDNFFWFNGVIDELKIYNRVLSESEIQELYESGMCIATLVYGRNSKEVEFLRYFRDNFLRILPEGQKLIRFYYEWSSIIIRTVGDADAFQKEVRGIICKMYED